MIVRLVKLTIEPGKLTQFLDNFELVKTRIRSFTGCTHLELLQDKDQKGVLFTYSLWDKQSSLDDYLSSELFIATWKQVKPLFSAKAQAWSLIKADEVSV